MENREIFLIGFTVACFILLQYWEVIRVVVLFFEGLFIYLCMFVEKHGSATVDQRMEGPVTQ